MKSSAPVPFPNQRQYKRSKLLILPRFQLPILGANIVTALVTSMIVWFTTKGALQDLKPAAALSGYEIEVFRRYLDYQTAVLESSLALSLMIGLAVSTFFTLIISHRLSGPMVRMRNYFRGILMGGPVKELEFRDGDYMRDLPPIINGAIERIRSEADENTEREKKSA